jgi:hypothetical protein
MIELTPEQHQTLASSGPEPVRAIDPATNAEYVLVRREVYDRLKTLLSEDEQWLRDAYPAAMEVFARDGWDDPRMDVYNALDPRRQPRTSSAATSSQIAFWQRGKPMSLPFDATHKDFVRIYTKDFEDQLHVTGPGPSTVLNVDLSTISAATDVVLGHGDPLVEIIDLNFQASRDDRLSARVLVYNALLHHRFGSEGAPGSDPRRDPARIFAGFSRKSLDAIFTIGGELEPRKKLIRYG